MKKCSQKHLNPLRFSNLKIATIIFIFTFLFACKNGDHNSSITHIVRNGVSENTILPGDICNRNNDCLECTSKRDPDQFNNTIYFSKKILEGDFKIKAKISLAKIDGTTSLFSFFKNHFGFDSDDKVPGYGKRLFLYLPKVDSLIYFDSTKNYFQEGEVFTFEISRSDSIITFKINNKELTKLPIDFFGRHLSGSLGFRPWNNTLRIYDWNISANFAPPDTLNYIFKRGEAGYSCFRIPSIIEVPNNDLLAFAEGRKNTCRDNGNVDIVFKRSIDGGKNWGPVQVLWDDSSNTCAYPVPIVDQKSGRLSLLCVWNLGEDHWSEIFRSAGKDTRRVFLFHSIDDGNNWSKQKEITKDVKLPSWDYYGIGAGSGIQLTITPYSGRMVAASYHSTFEQRAVFRSHLIFSDDGGLNWNIGGFSPETGTSEGEVTELSNGALMLNMTKRSGNIKPRSIAYSYDGGHHIVDQRLDKTLYGPTCQASLDRYKAPNGKYFLLFCNPYHPKERENLTVHFSSDDGNSWQMANILFEGPSSNSDLLVMKNGTLGCAFECGAVSPYEGIAFKTFEIDIND